MKLQRFLDLVAEYFLHSTGNVDLDFTTKAVIFTVTADDFACANQIILPNDKKESLNAAFKQRLNNNMYHMSRFFDLLYIEHMIFIEDLDETRLIVRFPDLTSQKIDAALALMRITPIEEYEDLTEALLWYSKRDDLEEADDHKGEIWHSVENEPLAFKTLTVMDNSGQSCVAIYDKKSKKYFQYGTELEKKVIAWAYQRDVLDVTRRFSLVRQLLDQAMDTLYDIGTNEGGCAGQAYSTYCKIKEALNEQ